MMQRILDLPEETRAKYDVSSLKVVAASGSALPGDLATRWMDEFGDTLYNLYGSTEVAWASIATPADMRAAPGTAGLPPRGTVVKLYDEDGHEVKPGDTGRIFVGNEMLFEGYTGGGSKDVIGNLMATGDVGRFDDAGRMFVEGRDDEMIVSGGENVFPKEVEDLLSRHDAVSDVAAVGVDDKDFGQRLRAFVVLESGKKATEDDLKGYVKENLARYKVPREIVFIDELPRNATGKVLKRELKDQGGARRQIGVSAPKPGTASRTKREEQGMDTGVIIAIVVAALILLAVLWFADARAASAVTRHAGTRHARSGARPRSEAPRPTGPAQRPTSRRPRPRRQEALARERAAAADEQQREARERHIEAAEKDPDADPDEVAAQFDGERERRFEHDENGEVVHDENGQVVRDDEQYEQPRSDR